jgi:hypothetical protein
MLKKLIFLDHKEILDKTNNKVSFARNSF